MSRFRFVRAGVITALSSATRKYRIPDSGGTITYSRAPQGLQPSVVAGVGLQYNVLPKFSLYAEPGIRYYFDANQSPSIRTMQPWMVSLELGLRYDLGK